MCRGAHLELTTFKSKLGKKIARAEEVQTAHSFAAESGSAVTSFPRVTGKYARREGFSPQVHSG